jgi:hypothetical protein
VPNAPVEVCELGEPEPDSVHPVELVDVWVLDDPDPVCVDVDAPVEVEAEPVFVVCVVEEPDPD